ncbi:unnamed protein product [Symbiodinium sp. CCMP2592]|nr:unnamed protein product [Symbiodinium sp. CCMP2592]
MDSEHEVRATAASASRKDDPLEQIEVERGPKCAEDYEVKHKLSEGRFGLVHQDVRKRMKKRSAVISAAKSGKQSEARDPFFDFSELEAAIEEQRLLKASRTDEFFA